eukprot:6260171-Amphidinium_carterae.2
MTQQCVLTVARNKKMPQIRPQHLERPPLMQHPIVSDVCTEIPHVRDCFSTTLRWQPEELN